MANISFTQQKPPLLYHNFMRALSSGKHSDFTIQLNQGCIKVHSLILRTLSPYFEAMLANENLKETQERTVRFVDFDDETIKKTIEWFYTCSSDHLQECGLLELEKIFCFINYIQATELQQSLINVLSLQISNQPYRYNTTFMSAVLSFLHRSLLEIATIQKFDTNSLLKDICTVLFAIPPDKGVMEEFCALTPAQITNLVSTSDGKARYTEGDTENFLKFIAAWNTADPESRTASTTLMLQTIPLPCYPLHQYSMNLNLMFESPDYAGQSPSKPTAEDRQRMELVLTKLDRDSILKGWAGSYHLSCPSELKRSIVFQDKLSSEITMATVD